MDIKRRGEVDVASLAKRAPLPLLGILGGLASCTAEVCTFPLDNIKTRMQMNGKEGLPSYSSLLDCFKKTIQSQGISGFYRGLSASLLRQLPYSTVRIYTYEKINRLFTADVQEVHYVRKLFAGGVAGAVGCIFGTPGDVLKIRMINDLMKTKYSGLIDCGRQTIEASGLQGFLKGLLVNVARATIVNACELATYDTFKSVLIRQFACDKDRMTTHFGASAMAGFVAAVASSPVDVIKTRVLRYMNQLKGSQQYSSALNCGLSVFKEEGPLAFYKGFIPYFLRITPWTIIMFVTFEKYKYLTLPQFVQ